MQRLAVRGVNLRSARAALAFADKVARPCLAHFFNWYSLSSFTSWIRQTPVSPNR
jgi:hypothetical protein